DDQLLVGLAEDAATRLVSPLDVLEAPGRPERLRHGAEPSEPYARTAMNAAAAMDISGSCHRPEARLDGTHLQTSGERPEPARPTCARVGGSRLGESQMIGAASARSRSL